MLSINTNLSSLIAQRSMKQSTNKLNQAIERMTTGAKINHAKDNAANYNIATNMTTKLGALQVAEDNAAMGLDMLATANGPLDQIHDKLQRLRDLAVQSSNGTYGSQSKQAINSEANALVDEIERLYNTSEYNGINLMKGQVTGSEESNFIKDIDRRDTSKMTTLASVDVSTKLNSGTYSISTPEELAKLATMTNNGLIGACCEFVLANDIDLSAYSSGAGWVPIGSHDPTNNYASSFSACFNGNGYKVDNLYINRNEKEQGLFGTIRYGSVKNLSVINANITSSEDEIAVICGRTIEYGEFENCYVSGNVSHTAYAYNAGGIVGFLHGGKIIDCYSLCNISSTNYVGGIAGAVYSGDIQNCYSNGDISGQIAGGLVGFTNYGLNIFNSYSCTNLGSGNKIGGLIGQAVYETKINIYNCYVDGISSNLKGIFVGEYYLPLENSYINIQDSYFSEIYVDKEIVVGADLSRFTANNIQAYSGNVPFEITNESKIISYTGNMSLQVGINNNDSSTISLDFLESLGRFSVLRNLNIFLESNLDLIDSMLTDLSEKQINFGATENRLESALGELSVQYENLISSRSTIQDADIAEVSSEYIRQQILQQASATLLATANQSAGIALQLI